MTKLQFLLAVAATMTISGGAQAAPVEVLSPSIIKLGEPAKEKAVENRDLPMGFVPSVPPPPGTEIPVERPKVVGNPPATIGADMMSSGGGAPAEPAGIEPTPLPSNEKTSAIGKTESGESEPQPATQVDLKGMELRID